MPAVQIVDYRVDLLEDAARLRAEIWGGTPAVNLAYLDWKYRANPYLPEPVMQFALAGGRVVGMRASVGTCWEIPGTGRRHVIPHGADAAVDPARRSSGVFRALIGRALEAQTERGFGHTMSLSANAVSRSILVGEGWSVVGYLEALECGAPRWRLPRSRVVQRAAALLPSRPVTDVFAVLDDFSNEAVTISSAPRPGAMAELCRRTHAENRLRHVRDEAYFEWRYANPLSAYRFLFLGGETLDAYVVVQWGGTGRLVSIIDWEGSTVESLSRLFVVIGQGGFGPVRIWRSTMDSGTEECLAAAGYVSASSRGGPPGASFILRPLTGEGPAAWLIDGLSVGSLDGWTLRMADSDAY